MDVGVVVSMLSCVLLLAHHDGVPVVLLPRLVSSDFGTRAHHGLDLSWLRPRGRPDALPGFIVVRSTRDVLQVV